MSGYQCMTIVGRLGKDPELSHVGASNIAKCSMSVATSEKRKDSEEEVSWHRLTAWGQTAETCSQYLRKGAEAGFVGRIKYGSYTDKDQIKRYTTEVMVDRMFFVGSKGDNQGTQGGDKGTNQGQSAPSGGQQGGQASDLGYSDGVASVPPIDEDNLPF